MRHVAWVRRSVKVTEKSYIAKYFSHFQKSGAILRIGCIRLLCDARKDKLSIVFQELNPHFPANLSCNASLQVLSKYVFVLDGYNTL